MINDGLVPGEIDLDTDASIGKVSFFSVSLNNEILHYRVLDRNSNTDEVTYYRVDNYDNWVNLKKVLSDNTPNDQIRFKRAALEYLKSIMNDERKDDVALEFNKTIGRNLDMSIVEPLCKYIASLNTNC